MPKIRGIKPDFWTDEDIVELSIAARLLFIGMWNFACDNGHLDDKPKQLKMRILPGDDVSVDKLIAELVDNGRIVRSNGTITILKFAHHQKPHSRWWSTCDLPECVKPDHPTTVAETSPKGANNGGATVGNGMPPRTTAVVDVDVDVDGELKVTREGKRATQLPDDFKPSTSIQEMAIQQGVDLRAEFPQFVDHHRAKGSTFKDWDAALRTWIRNAAKFRKGPAPVLAAVKDPALLPPVEANWMRRPRT